MSIQLFQAVLNKQFYLDYKDLIPQDLFTGEVKDLYKVVVWAYENGTNSLTPDELKLLYTERCPTETLAKRSLIDRFLAGVKSMEPIQEPVALLALKQARINYKQDEAASLLLEPDVKLDKVKELIQEIEALKNGEVNQDIVDMDIDYLLSRTEQNSKWKFNIPALADFVTGIGEATFTLIAGRVNSGKSLASISLCFSPLGFVEQGAKVLYLCNEEDAAFTGIRAVMSYTGMNIDQIRANKLDAAKIFAKIRDRVIPIDNAKMSMSLLSKMVAKYKPDIVVADMLDHVQVTGDYAREDQRLGQVYRQAREIAKEYRCAFIGVSQTSAESDGKMHYGFDALANSKTEKPAACDLILLIGADAPDHEGNYSLNRAINVAKNKITGRHGAATCIIQPEISRLVA